MITNLKPYPAYKDSGVPWLGQVPEHWEVRRTKTLFQSRKQLNTDGSETNVLSLTLRGVVNNDPDNPEGLVPKDYKTYQIFERDDLVFKLIDLENVRTSRVGLVHERGIMSPAYVRLTLSGMGEVRFYYQQFYDLYQRSIYNQIGEGVRSTIGWSDLANLRILAPPLPEQTAIVRFLDWAERRIRRYIHAKQKLIKLLEEYKQALIHQAVTGQINVRTGQPYPAYKPSGVEWLGQVPEHWEVRRVRNIVEMRVSNVDKHSKEGEEPVRLCNYVDVYKHDRIRANMEFMKATASAEEIERFRLEHGDVLITKDSEAWDDIGVPALVESSAPDLISGYHLALLRPKQSAEGAFLLRTLQSRPVAYQFHVEAKGVTRYGLSHHAIKSTSVPLPPLPEQAAIVEYLDAQTAKIDAAIAAARREIDLLREYRTRLIADVVTGKVDVRTVKCEVGSVNDETEEDEVGWEEAPHEDGEVEDGLEGEMCEADTDEEV